MNEYKNATKDNIKNIQVVKDFDFSKYSSIGCGGIASKAYFPKNITEIINIVEELNDKEEKFIVLGNMTNILPPDGIYKTKIIFTKKLKAIGIGSSVCAMSGVNINEFLNALQRHGLTGAEFLSGIPGSIGGAIYMNAGALGHYISEIIENVFVYENHKIQIIPNNKCGYSYKSSNFMKNHNIILGASFNLNKSCSEEVERLRKKYNDKRKHLPKGKSMGCVFKNTSEYIAGKLIEDAFLKGKSINDAYVSKEHGNFIINKGNAKVEDIVNLIEYVKDKVEEKFKVRMEEEIIHLQ